MVIIYNKTSYVWEDLCKEDKELMRESYLKELNKKNALKEQKEVSKEPESYYKPKKKRK